MRIQSPISLVNNSDTNYITLYYVIFVFNLIVVIVQKHLKRENKMLFIHLSITNYIKLYNY